MKRDASHIRRIRVVSNTHWDREFRRSFEKTRRGLVAMLDTTLDILDADPRFHSFTMDGHAVMIDDYLEIRPERRPQIERLVASGRLAIGPWYTLVEQFSVGQEPLVRNLLRGRATVEKYGGRPGTVAYTPASWGQTGQLPQLLADFGLRRMMFYRGVSHHETDAEYVWCGADGTRVLASRFAVYARYNWYYQVHRPITRAGRVLEKDYRWGEFDETPFIVADASAAEDNSYALQHPSADYQRSRLEKAIRDMVEKEGPHFTTDIFLAMNGHDISVAHPLEPRVIEDAKAIFAGRYDIAMTDLEGYWTELERSLELERLPVLRGERRSFLKTGMWTYLFPFTISTRTYLKQQDFAATNRLVAYAEPLASLAAAFGAPYPARYLARGWTYLLSNHTHDANGGCAPDVVCRDMEYRYAKASDIGDIVTEDAMAYLARSVHPGGDGPGALRLVVYNPLPFVRDAVVALTLEVPRTIAGPGVALAAPDGGTVDRQVIANEPSSVFVDSPWDVPTILDTRSIRMYAHLKGLPALGYRCYAVAPEAVETRDRRTLVTGPRSLENDHVEVAVNDDGTVDLRSKATGREFHRLNYLWDQGEWGNAWQHARPREDATFTSLGASAAVSVVETGPLSSAIAAEYAVRVPADCEGGRARSSRTVELPVRVRYRLTKDSPLLEVLLTVDNRAKDHWLRAAFPTGIAARETWTDSHFDVLARPVAVPDSTGWVEEAFGTQPLRSWVDLTDGRDGLAVLPKGLYEYEALEDRDRTLLLTLIRACRIKLVVSNEKQTLLADTGIQCPGQRSFEYAILAHEGDWRTAHLPRVALEYAAPPRAAAAGRGRGTLPREASLLKIDNPEVLASCVKGAEDGKGLIVRLYNPTAVEQRFTLAFGCKVSAATRCRMDESAIESCAPNDGTLQAAVGPKKILTFRIVPG